MRDASPIIATLHQLPKAQPLGDAEPSTSSFDIIEVRILTRAEVETIDPVAWDLLADRSCVPNPCYERWNLLPAVRHLDKKYSVFVVAAYRGGRLVCLFPVLLKRKFFLAPCLSVWQFKDCMNSDVLYEAGVPLPSIFRDVMNRLRAPIMISASHSIQGFDVATDCSAVQRSRLRKAVTKAIGWDHYQRRLPSKYRKENKRITTRLMRREGARYVTSDSNLSDTWLPWYCSVEERSWKVRDGRPISSDIDRMRYFKEAIQEGERKKKVEFQGLFLDDDVLAMSIRFRAQCNAYDIKTSYVENYKKLYPGVVLELLNLKNVLNGHYATVDSCVWNNRVVERIWPDDIELYRTVLFNKSPIGVLARTLYQRSLQSGKSRCPNVTKYEEG